MFQICPIVVSRLSQRCLKLVPKLSQNFLKVIPKLSQSCPDIVSKLPQDELIECLSLAELAGIAPMLKRNEVFEEGVI